LKRCFKCFCEKPLADFYRHSEMGDGHLNKCKDCTKIDVNAHRALNQERIRAYDRMRASMPHRIAKGLERQRKDRLKHPEKNKARAMVAQAVRAGTLLRWPVCEVPTCESKPEAHHPHYGSPLVVTWLCSLHHHESHQMADSEVME
jgi:hypothetical protein